MSGESSQYDAAFLDAVRRVLGHEGDYSNDDGDRGGETRFGISRLQYPLLDIANLTRNAAIEIYWRDYWLKFHFDRLPALIAAKVLDLAIVMGPANAVMCLQSATRACRDYRIVNYRIARDGVIGAETLEVVGLIDPGTLLVAIRCEAASTFRLIAERAPTNQKFLEGWLNRAYA
jgi:lysozyme family protein